MHVLFCFNVMKQNTIDELAEITSLYYLCLLKQTKEKDGKE